MSDEYCRLNYNCQCVATHSGWLGSYRLLTQWELVIRGGNGLSAFCRWVDTQLKPPNRRLCLKFWDVPSNKRQVRFVSGLVGRLCRPESCYEV